VTEVWLDDEDPALARTMAALDREIRNGERFMVLIPAEASMKRCEFSATWLRAASDSGSPRSAKTMGEPGRVPRVLPLEGRGARGLRPDDRQAGARRRQLRVQRHLVEGGERQRIAAQREDDAAERRLVGVHREVWLDDEDPALARTMAALDREIRNGERFMERAEDMKRCEFSATWLRAASDSGSPRSAKTMRRSAGL
jgi:hypothetical protein